MSPEAHTKLLAVLSEILELLRQPDLDVNWSPYETPEQAVHDLESHFRRVENRDFSQIRTLEKLFGPNGALQEIAESNGWAKRFLTLAHYFDCCISGE